VTLRASSLQPAGFAPRLEIALFVKASRMRSVSFADQEIEVVTDIELDFFPRPATTQTTPPNVMASPSA
jgi:hypothetical protein